MKLEAFWKWIKAFRDHDDDNYHAVPTGDIFEHLRSESCPCLPLVIFDEKTRNRDVIHRKMKELPH